jgi:Ser/Thr protein kinase RdoA (MazF antagonist)
MDFRAQELAICLSKYVSAAEPLPYLRDFISGFKSSLRLTEKEARAVPGLISLRVVSNVIYFVGRAIAGEDDITSLTSRADEYARRIRWIEANEDVLLRELLS